MEVSEGKDEGLVGNSSECTVAESGEQTLGRVQGTFGEGFEDGSCNGDDLMVEVLGSEVFVGGVRTCGSGEILDKAGPENEPLGGARTEEEGSLEVKDQVSVAVVAMIEKNEAQSLETCSVSGDIGVETDKIENFSEVEVEERDLGVEKGDVVGFAEVESVELRVESDKVVLVGDEVEVSKETCSVSGDIGVESEKIENFSSSESVEEVEVEVRELGDGIRSDREVLVGNENVEEMVVMEDSGVETRVLEENADPMSCELGGLGKGVVSDSETDGGENLAGLGEEAKIEIGNSSAENRDLDPESSCPPDHVVVVETEVTVTELVSVSEPDDALSNDLIGDIQKMEEDVRVSQAEEVKFEVEVRCEDEQLKPEDPMEEGVTGDVSANMMQEESVAEEETSNVHEVENQRETSPEIGDITENEIPVDDENTTSVDQPTDSVNAETAEMDNQVSDYLDTDEVMISEADLLEHPDIYQSTNGEKVFADSDTSLKNIAEEVVVVEEIPPNTNGEKIASLESPEPGSSRMPKYELPPEYEDVFSVPDLVWGKVKSHPWWPGQIFDFTDASDKAMKHHKKDCLLVAYFGDRTFAWNEESTLRSFRTHFSQMVSQCNGDTFHKAVGCALEEVSRRVELSLACHCVPKDLYDNIRVQVVENAGIRSESSRREGVDESAGVSFFRAEKLIEYIGALARSPSGKTDDLGLAIAKAQLLSFGRFRGYCSLPEFQFCGELAENDTAGPGFHDFHQDDDVFELSKDDGEASSSQEMISRAKSRSSLKRKHNLREGIYPKVKEKSLSELMGSGGLDYPDDDRASGKRRRTSDNHHHGDDSPAAAAAAQEGRKTTSLPKASTPPKQSFKIGECIRRAASQMTADRAQRADGNGNDVPSPAADSTTTTTTTTEYSSLDELLFQLHSVARDPLKEYGFSNVIVNFFSDFRNSVTAGAGAEAARKRKIMSPETFEFDDMNDTYWTDRVIQNGAEEEEQPIPPPPQQPRKSRKKDNPEKTPRPYNRKRVPNSAAAAAPAPEKPAGYVGEDAPAELVMNFSEVRAVPPEGRLSRMFRRFGPLREAETEVDAEGSRARVVFKRCSDAEVAFDSAVKFSIFGPTLVNYQLNYTPTAQFRPVPHFVTIDHDMQLALSAHDHEMQLDLDHDMHLDLDNLSAFEVNLV